MRERAEIFFRITAAMLVPGDYMKCLFAGIGTHQFNAFTPPKNSRNNFLEQQGYDQCHNPGHQYDHENVEQQRPDALQADPGIGRYAITIDSEGKQELRGRHFFREYREVKIHP